MLSLRPFLLLKVWICSALREIFSDFPSFVEKLISTVSSASTITSTGLLAVGVAAGDGDAEGDGDGDAAGEREGDGEGDGGNDGLGVKVGVGVAKGVREGAG